jgi:hypothetical protein
VFAFRKTIQQQSGQKGACARLDILIFFALLRAKQSTFHRVDVVGAPYESILRQNTNSSAQSKLSHIL